MGRWNALVLVCALVLLALPAPAVQAQDGQVPLAEGTWLGTMGAGGVLTGTVEGADGVWTGWIDGSFTFDVAGGAPDGTWQWAGGADVLIVSPEGTVDLRLDAHADGPVGGSSSRLELTGEQRTRGEATVQGRHVAFGPIPNPTRPVDVVITDTSCYTASGDWTTSLEAWAAQEGNLSGDLDGFFLATNIAEPGADPAVAADLAERFEDLYDRAMDAIGGLGGSFATSTLLDYLLLLEEAAALEAEIERLEDSCVLDPAEQPWFATSLTSLLASVLRAHIPAMGPSDLFNAAQALVAAGAMGAGAHEVVADQVEPAVIERAEELLATAIDTGDVQGASQLLIVADLLGAQLTHDGAPVTFADVVGG